MAIKELKPNDLKKVFDFRQFKFRTTKNIKTDHAIIGQERAMRAMEFGVGIKSHGFNIFSCGVPGTG
ncbi:AAA family ATPase, partial [bacterium]|nr:AAA family ATPase [bacterium]